MSFSSRELAGGSNPFSSPSPDASRHRHRNQDVAKAGVGNAFLRFERMRIAYNLVLVTVTAIMMMGNWTWTDHRGELALTLLAGAIGSNVCYSVGTVIAGYMALIGRSHRLITYIIFGLGTCVAVMLAVVILMGTMASW